MEFSRNLVFQECEKEYIISLINKSKNWSFIISILIIIIIVYKLHIC